MRIFVLHEQAKRNEELESRLQEAMKANVVHEKSIETLKKQIKQEQKK